MDFFDDAIKARIYELQERFGNTARERQGKRIGIVEKYKYDHKKMDESEKLDYEMRQAYQKFLESPDKILSDFIGESKRTVAKKYKAIKLMCALEAANNVEEAGKACLYGMSKDLFGLGVEADRTSFAYRQLANGSLQNDIEKRDMAIAEKIRENLRISRTTRPVRTAGFADPSQQTQPVKTPSIDQTQTQPVKTPSIDQTQTQPGKTPSRYSQDRRPPKPRNVTWRQGGDQNLSRSTPPQPTIQHPRNEKLVVHGVHRSDKTIIPTRQTTNRSDDGRSR